MIFSSTLERAKLSVKVPSAAESGEGPRRRLSSSNGYGPYVETKTMQIGSTSCSMKTMQINGTTSSSMVPPASASSFAAGWRLKGGSVSSIWGGRVPRHDHQTSDSEQLDLYHASRMKGYGGEMETSLLLKRKAAPSSSSPSPPIPPPLDHDSCSGVDALPQWGLGKRSRRSRFEALKPVSIASRAHEAVRKALPRADKQSNGDAKVPGEGWSSRQAINIKGVQAARNGNYTGLHEDNALANHHSSPARHGCGEKLERARGAAEKTEHRQGSDPSRSADEPRPATNGHQCHGGHTGGTSHHNVRSSSGTDTAAVAAAIAVPVLQTLDWPRILIGLSRKEKEEDFQKIKGPGSKLSQRPKKRPKVVERALLYCTPGNSLCDLSRARYHVKEQRPVRKRPRGLKAMQSMESESE